MKKRLSIVSLLLVLVFALAACGGSDSDADGDGCSEKFKVGFAIKTQDSPYFVALVDAVKELAEEEGWDLTVLDAGDDIGKEAENMDTLISQGRSEERRVGKEW